MKPLENKHIYFTSENAESDKISEYIEIQKERNIALKKMLEEISKIDLTKEIKSDEIISVRP